MEVLTVFKYNSFKIPNRNIEKPLLKNGRISCDGSVTSNIGVDWLNFRTRVFLKKKCFQTFSPSRGASNVARNLYSNLLVSVYRLVACIYSDTQTVID